MKKLLTATIVLLGLCLSGAIVHAEAVVEDVTIDPANPDALDTITITATITSDEDIDEVLIKIKECDDNMCMPTEEFEMNLENGMYTLTHDLAYTKATYFEYMFVITSGGNETETNFTHIEVNPAENGGNGGDSNGNGDDGIPGFELIPLFIATLIIIFYMRRKRSR
jgi:hypothetical protein